MTARHLEPVRGEPLIGADQVAERLGISVEAVYGLTKNRVLRHCRLGVRTVRYDPEDVERFRLLQLCGAEPASGFAAISMPEVAPISGPVVYIGHEEGGSAFKIGYTKSLRQRLAKYKTHNTRKFLLVKVLENGSLELEHELHVHLRKWRLQGEWFLASPVVVDFIARIP